MRRNEKPKQAVFLLLSELLRSERLPPITLLFIGLNVTFYLELLEDLAFSLNTVCLSVSSILEDKQWLRIIFSPFFHVDDWHLYYNMVSFCIKGRSLEKRYGSYYFSVLLLVFSISCSLAYILIEYVAAYFIFKNYSLLNSCAVGFSGVIFALKVLTTHHLQSGTIYTLKGSLSVPSKYAYWFELIAISILTPNASFAGHLAGVLVGLLYIYGPLKFVIKQLSDSTSNFIFFQLISFLIY
jgi:rhomboid domain-containing protein 1